MNSLTIAISRITPQIKNVNFAAGRVTATSQQHPFKLQKPGEFLVGVHDVAGGTGMMSVDGEDNSLRGYAATASPAPACGAQLIGDDFPVFHSAAASGSHAWLGFDGVIWLPLL